MGAGRAAVLASSDRWEGCHPAVTRTPSGKRYTGHSLRAQYQKNFVSSGTAFSLASYRYSSSGYYDFAEASALESAGAVDNRRRREELSVSQSLGGWAVWRFPRSQEYWHRQSRDETVHLGFYSARKGISGVGYYTRASGQQNDRSVIQYQYSAGWSAVRQRGELQHHLGQQWLYLAADVAVWRGADAAKSVLLGSARLWQPGTRLQQQRLPDYHGGFGNAQIGYRHDAASNQLTGRRRLGGRASARRHLRPDGG